jgi:hypothetical protein
MSKYLCREAILNANDIKTEEVKVPEWGGVVLVKGLTGLEKDRYDQSVYNVKDGNVNYTNMRAKLVALSICGEDLKPIFATADIEALGQKSAAALNRVFEVAQRLSAAEVEELEKN